MTLAATAFLASLLALAPVSLSEQTTPRYPSSVTLPAPPQSKAELVTRDLVNLLVNDAMIGAITQQATDIAYTMGKQGLQSQLKRDLNVTEEEKLKSAIQRTMAEIFPKRLWQDALVPVY